MIKRRQLFEFEDQQWIPDIIRDYLRDVVMHLTSGIYLAAAPKILEVLQKNNSHQILDLCSGAGGPAPLIHNIIQERCNYELKLILSDKYLHENALIKNNAQANNISYHTESLDVREVPKNMKGVRTIFTAFHHFIPQTARKILLDSQSKNTTLAIFEFTERKLSSIFTMLLSTLVILLITPTIKPFKFSRLLFTYLIPIIPIIYYWDSVVSHVRSYSVEELKKMTEGLEDNNYKWEVGQIETRFKNRKITYIVGSPKK